MAIIKCKMCGGDLALIEGQSVAECEYCGSRQTVPSADNEKKLTLFARANRLRAACEFDKAAGIYESIVADFPEEAEAYWGLVLCKYGIEYVDDPASGKKIPTCHRSSFDSIMDDSNFEQAMENADEVALRVYRQEAKAIEEVRKGILEVSSSEKPYDIFICYKETDSKGDRTVDSLLAQDIYDALTGKGYRVFFSRITLEDKLGQAYEPYIFAALNSAKIMLAVGTCYEHYNAVWVKNEWSRYLKIVAQDKNKYLIPCYKNIDAYDIPKEFAHLQGQDMGKVGAISDLLRGIEKLVPLQKSNTFVIQEKVVVGGSGNNKIAALLERGNMALEDGDWAKADSFFEDVLNNDAKNAQAYIGKTLALERCRTMDALVRKRKDVYQNVSSETLFIDEKTAHIEQMAEQYSLRGYVSADSVRKLYEFDLSYLSEVSGRQKQYREEENWWQNHKQLSRAEKFAAGAVAEHLQSEKKHLFAQLAERVKKAQEANAKAIAKAEAAYDAHIAEADKQAEQLYNDGLARREQHYQGWLNNAKNATTPDVLKKIAAKFDSLGDYKDSKNLAEHCRKRAADEQAKIDAENKRKAEAARLEAEARAKRNKIVGIISGIVAVLTVVAIVVITTVVIPANKRSSAEEMLAAGNYDGAIAIYQELEEPDNVERMKETAARNLMGAGEYQAAYTWAYSMDYSDGRTRLLEDINQYGRYYPVKYHYNSNSYTVTYNAQGFPDRIVHENYGLIYRYQYDSAGHITTCIAEGVEDPMIYIWEFYPGQARCIFDEKTEYEDIRWDSITGGLELIRFEGVRRYQFVHEEYDINIDLEFDQDGYITRWKRYNEEGTASWHRDENGKLAGWENYDGSIPLSNVDHISYDDYGNMVLPNGSVQRTYDEKGRILYRNAFDSNEYTYTYDEVGNCVRMDYIYDWHIAWQWFDYAELNAQAQERDARLAKEYAVAEELVNNGETYKAAIAFAKMGDYKDARERSLQLWDEVTQRDTIGTGTYRTEALKSNGTVIAIGNNEYDMSGLDDIIAISTGTTHTACLKSDGTVVAVGDNSFGQCEVSDWTDIVAISAGNVITVGLKADGTVVATEYIGRFYHGQCEVSDWTDIVAISAGSNHTVGLKSDGTVVAVGLNESSQCNVSGWKDIVAVSAGGFHTVGLKADGTAVAVGQNDFGQCDVSDRRDIIAIRAGWKHTVGLKADGTVVAIGFNWQKQCDVSNWRDIVAISADIYHTVGLKADGTVVAVGNNDYGQCDVSGWKNIKLPQ